MNTTPAPLTCTSRRMTDRQPIGTRYIIDEDTYTLVAYSIDPHDAKHAYPLLIDDTDLSDGTPNLMYPQDILSDDEALEAAPANPEIADQARAAAIRQYQDRPYRDTGELQRVMAFSDLPTEDDLDAFLAFGRAELELRQAQRELERVSRKRSERIARIADLKGSQRAAAQTLGINQSTVSRALRERPERP